MSRYLSNRDGGKTDELGHGAALKRAFSGDVISGWTVTQAGTPNLTVSVASGVGMITTGIKKYEVWSDATESVTIGTPSTSNPRDDLIVAYVDLAVTPTTTNPNNPAMWKLADVQGTPAATPAEPSAAQIQAAIGASNPYIILAKVRVNANATSITNANITDRRSFLLPTLQDNALDITKIINRWYCQITKTTSVSIPNVTPTLLNFTAAITDPNTMWTAGQPSRMTAKKRGLYLVIANITIDSGGSGGRRAVQLYKNGTLISPPAYYSLFIGGSGTNAPSAVDFVEMNVNDYIEVYAWQDSGATATISTSGSRNGASMALIAPY